MTRLEELHKAFEEKQTHKQKEWMFTYNENPPHSDLVDVWRSEVSEGASFDMFGFKARWIPEDGAWYTQGFHWVDWNIVAWKDIE